jgi:diguanylate cyclase (GGDEF)-like protein
MIEEVRPTILLVDDEPINISVLAEFLRQEYRLLFAKTGHEALRIVQEKQPDLVLLDIGLPDISGYDVCRSLKTNQATQNIPIVFSTAKDSAEDEVIGLNIGASDYITKPFNLSLIRARVRNQIRLKQKTDLLEQLANLDGLTELPNRRYFDEHFESEWRRAARRGVPVSVALADVDCFKGYNDRYGHSAGDDCLRAVARSLAKSASRGGEFVARYGGEEFIFVWPEVELKESIKAAELACQLVQNLNIENLSSECSEVVTVSIGVASLTPTAEFRKSDLIEAADEQLYKAKNQGRNRVVGQILE